MCVHLVVTQSCLILCNTMNCSLPGFSVHGILGARILEWIDIPFFRGSSWPRDQTLVSCIIGRFFTIWATRKSTMGRGKWTMRVTLFSFENNAIERTLWKQSNTIVKSINDLKYISVFHRYPQMSTKRIWINFWEILYKDYYWSRWEELIFYLLVHLVSNHLLSL